MSLTVHQHREEVGLRDGALLVAGQWRQARSGKTWTHLHPATQERIGEFPVADTEDVDEAVRAARRAFEEGPWPTMPAGQRAKALHRYANLLREHADELRALQALDNGVPLSFGSVYAGSVDVAADVFDHHAGWIDKAGGETFPGYQGGEHLAMTVREPIGVVAAILPWNAPFLLFAQKLAPALAAGCTVVLKPSEYATFSVLRMVELLLEAGVPDGVVNVVTGPGDPTGEALITHPMVDKVSFTGSRETGRRIVEASAGTMKRVSLELGGKSANIVFADADLERAAATAPYGVFDNAGQDCCARSRILVQRSVHDRFMELLEPAVRGVAVGDPSDENTEMGPLISAEHRARVAGYVPDDAPVAIRGETPHGSGFWFPPTVLAPVDPAAPAATEEIFGPVVVVIPFDDEDEAVRLANDSAYGLSGSIWTSDVSRALRVTRGIDAGNLSVNSHASVRYSTPFGGFKRSGLGRELGPDAPEAFTEIKNVFIAVD